MAVCYLSVYLARETLSGKNPIVRPACKCVKEESLHTTSKTGFNFRATFFPASLRCAEHKTKMKSSPDSYGFFTHTFQSGGQEVVSMRMSCNCFDPDGSSNCNQTGSVVVTVN